MVIKPTNLAFGAVATLWNLSEDAQLTQPGHVFPLCSGQMLSIPCCWGCSRKQSMLHQPEARELLVVPAGNVPESARRPCGLAVKSHRSTPMACSLHIQTLASKTTARHFNKFSFLAILVLSSFRAKTVCSKALFRKNRTQPAYMFPEDDVIVQERPASKYFSTWCHICWPLKWSASSCKVCA